MKTKLQIKSIFGKVLFEYEADENTIKKTVREFLKENSRKLIKDASLSGMDLSGVSFDNSRFYNARFDNSSFDNSRFYNSRFYNSSFYNSSFYNSRFYNSRFDNSRFDEKSKKSIAQYKYLWQIIPTEGSFIAYKKASGCVLKLEIPLKAKRVCNIINRKCRASYVKTLKITDSNGESIKEAAGNSDSKTIYKVGELTKADSFDDNFLNDCTNGIHFFVTRKEAENW